MGYGKAMYQCPLRMSTPVEIHAQVEDLNGSSNFDSHGRIFTRKTKALIGLATFKTLRPPTHPRMIRRYR